MNTNKLIFSQVMDHLPLHTFRRCVSRYHGNRYVKKFRCYEQYLVMAFSQLTHRESLRDIEVCLRAHQNKLYHMGISSSSVSRTTLSKANERRDWRIYADFAQSLIRNARPLYANEDLGIDLVNTVYALDASTIDLCLSVFPWALFRSKCRQSDRPLGQVEFLSKSLVLQCHCLSQLKFSFVCLRVSP